jgi:hypothetical protein
MQARAQAYADYYGAVADYGPAPFRPYRAVGHPAQCLSLSPTGPPEPATTPAPSPPG